MSNQVTLEAAEPVLTAARQKQSKSDSRSASRLLTPAQDDRLRPNERRATSEHRHRPAQGDHRDDGEDDHRCLAPLCQPGAPLHGIEATNGGLGTFAGGIAVQTPKASPWAPSVSAADSRAYHEVTEAGVAAFASA